MKYLKQPSTWRGIGILLGSLFGVNNPDYIVEITGALAAFLGGIELVRDEKG